MDVTSLMKPGVNVVAVTAVNGGDTPNPAGLIGTLVVRYRDGRTLADCYRQDVADRREGRRQVDYRCGGSRGMGPGHGARAARHGPLGKRRADTDFAAPLPGAGRHRRTDGEDRRSRPTSATRRVSSSRSLRYIHRRIEGSDVYFVANKDPQPEEAVCCFRVHGKRPELWWPETGRMEPAAVYDEADGCVRLPLRLDASGSVFVLFRDGAAIEPDRVVSVTRNGQPVLKTAGQPETASSGQAAIDSIELVRRATADSRPRSVSRAAMSSKRPATKAGRSMWPRCPIRRRSPVHGRCGLRRAAVRRSESRWRS